MNPALKMLAVQYRKSIPRYLWVRSLGAHSPRVVTGPGSFLRLARLTALPLPTAFWVRVRPLLSGICGSDVGAITGRSSLYLSSFLSFPFVPGHEVVGEVVEVGSKVTVVKEGDRVVLEPALGCTVRGFSETCRPCHEGHYANCERVTEGDISAGIQTGYCSDTGGGWGAQLVAHESQLHLIPPDLPNEAAVLAEPLSCAVHGVRRAQIREGDKVLVIGCGTIGLLVIAALKSEFPACTITAVARYPHQAKLAQGLGADYVVPAGLKGYDQLAKLSDATLHPLVMGNPSVLGGFDVVLECSGSPKGMEDALRWTRSQGQVVLMGVPETARLDLTALWYSELSVKGAYTYSREGNGEESVRSFQLAIGLLSRDGWAERLIPLVRHRFPLRHYRNAIATAMSPARYESVKTVFDFSDTGA